jgi:hypothetical protein
MRVPRRAARKAIRVPDLSRFRASELEFLESVMSRIGGPGVVMSRATNNVYTGLAFISMFVTLLALIYVLVQFMSLGVFK